MYNSAGGKFCVCVCVCARARINKYINSNPWAANETYTHYEKKFVQLKFIFNGSGNPDI
jgi:hypothetical protein